MGSRKANSRFRAHVDSHLDVLFDSSSRLINSPIASIMTVFVISIALILPALLQLVGNNLSLVNEQFEESAQITLYLMDTVTDDQGLAISKDLLERDSINQTVYISKARALAEFSANSEFSATLAELGDNPLPASIVVIPSSASVQDTRAMYDELRQLAEVETAQIDLEWIQRLVAIRAVVQRTGWIFTLILGLAVLFIVGNTIRLEIENRKNEIQVIKLVGGTDSFIARPFLYTGLLLGISGALVACGLIALIQLGFASSLDNLLSLYGTDFPLRGYGMLNSLGLVVLGGCLGWIGALVSTLQHLYGLAD